MFCSNCGAKLVDGKCVTCEPVNFIASDDASKLLTEANLLRIRGRIDEALAICHKAVVACPSSAPAHSLMGDLHKDKHEWNEAISWYKLAVQLNPNNTHDKEKLAVAINNVFDSKTAAAETKDLLPPREPFKLTPTTIIIGAVALAIIAVIFVLLWPSADSTHTVPPVGEAKPEVVRQTPLGSPQTNEDGIITTFPPQGADATNQNALTLPDGITRIAPNINAIDTSRFNSNTAQQQQNNTTNGTNSNNGGSNSTETSAERPPFIVDTQNYMSESEITKLTGDVRNAAEKISQNPHLNFTVNEISIDPRTVNATFRFTTPPFGSAKENKQVLLFAAFNLIWEADTVSSRRIKTYQFHGYTENASGQNTLAIAATVNHQQAYASTNHGGNYNNLLKYMSDVWWRPDLQYVPL